AGGRVRATSLGTQLPDPCLGLLEGGDGDRRLEAVADVPGQLVEPQVGAGVDGGEGDRADLLGDAPVDGHDVAVRGEVVLRLRPAVAEPPPDAEDGEQEEDEQHASDAAAPGRRVVVLLVGRRRRGGEGGGPPGGAVGAAGAPEPVGGGRGAHHLRGGGRHDVVRQVVPVEEVGDDAGDVVRSPGAQGEVD